MGRREWSEILKVTFYCWQASLKMFCKKNTEEEKEDNRNA